MDEKLSDLWVRVPDMTVGDAIVTLLLASIVLSLAVSIVGGAVRGLFGGGGEKRKARKDVR